MHGHDKFYPLPTEISEEPILTYLEIIQFPREASRE
jgi:hypothetical protein